MENNTRNMILTAIVCLGLAAVLVDTAERLLEKAKGQIEQEEKKAICTLLDSAKDF